jgi:rhamnosyltransferase
MIDRFPEVTIVILIFNPGPGELRTIDRVLEQDYPAPVKIIAIDSSPDKEAPVNIKVRDLVDRWEPLSPDDFGHAKTRNLGASLCETPIVVFLSQDALPTDSMWLHHLVTPLIRGVAEASYGRQQPPEQMLEREMSFAYFYPSEPVLKTTESASTLGIKAYHFSDVTSAFLTSVLQDLRFPDELDVFEDAGIAKRIMDAGYRIAYVPEAAVLHAHELDLKAMWRRHWKLGEVYQRLGIFRAVKESRQTKKSRPGSLRQEGMAFLRPGGSEQSASEVVRRIGYLGLKGLAFSLGRLSGAAKTSVR